MESDQQFCLRWNNHQSTLISQFDTLLESETLVDCTLAAEGKYLRAHKLVLSACSPYFEALLKLHYDKHPIFVLKDVKYKELRAMMNYMYRGEVNISQDQLGALLKAAESLQIKGLSDSNIGGEKKPTRQPSPQPPPITSKSLTISKQAIKQPASALDSDGLGSPSRGRETSSSPTPRKRKKLRRRSQDDHMPDNHDPHSNTSSTHSQPANVNIPLAPISKPALDSLLDPLETLKQVTSSALDQSLLSISAVHQNVNDNAKQDPHSELIIEPKAEYGDEDGNEELSLDNVDVDDLDQSQASIEYIQDHSANDDEMTEQQRDMQDTQLSSRSAYPNFVDPSRYLATQKPTGGPRACSSCHVPNPPYWRLNSQGEPICNACGQFGVQLTGVVKTGTSCTNCHTQNTTMWRRDQNGGPVCNACGLYYKLHQVNRPLSMTNKVIQTRSKKRIPSSFSNVITTKQADASISDNYIMSQVGESRKAENRDSVQAGPVIMSSQAYQYAQHSHARPDQEK